jgi:FHA domain/Domain of unknown function (DUF4389)
VDYPISVRFVHPEQLSRLSTFFRCILIIPHAFVLSFIAVAVQIALFLAWFAIIFTGRYPEWVYSLITGFLRWWARYVAYVFLLTDVYPPFSFEETSLSPSPESPMPAVVPISPSYRQAYAAPPVQAKDSVEARPASTPAVSRTAQLVVTRGGRSGHIYYISGDSVSLGRSSASSGWSPDIDLSADDPDKQISRKHARIFWKGNTYSIEDVGSTNGTSVNGASKLSPGMAQELHGGDEIVIGSTYFQFLFA